MTLSCQRTVAWYSDGLPERAREVMEAWHEGCFKPCHDEERGEAMSPIARVGQVLDTNDTLFAAVLLIMVLALTDFSAAWKHR